MDFPGSVGRDLSDRFFRSCRGPWADQEKTTHTGGGRTLGIAGGDERQQPSQGRHRKHRSWLLPISGPWARRLYQRLCPRSESDLAEIPVALFKTFLRNEANWDVTDATTIVGLGVAW